MNKVAIVVMTTALVLLAAFSVLGDERSWGDLGGRFVYDSEPPNAKAITVMKDKDALGKSIPDESLVVNKANRGLANVLIYLLPNEAGELLIHPSHEMSETTKVELSMHEGRFKPHVLLMRTTQTMVQKNRDPIGHFAHIHFRKNSPM